MTQSQRPLAFTAWQGGNGALANLALDRALADDASYSMARLLRDVIDGAWHPAVRRSHRLADWIAGKHGTLRPRDAVDSRSDPLASDHLPANVVHD